MAAYASTQVLKSAGERVRVRLRERPPGAEQEMLRNETNAAPESGARLRELSGLLGVKSELLHSTDRLQDILSVHRTELPSEIQCLFPKLGLVDTVNPFAFDLLDFVERKFREDPSMVQRSAFLPAPTNEEDWIKRIMEMTVEEFVTAIL